MVVRVDVYRPMHTMGLITTVAAVPCAGEPSQDGLTFAQSHQWYDIYEAM